MQSPKTTGIICTVLGGAMALWVITRLSSIFGQQQTWAPPFAAYEWTTLAGASIAAGLLIVGLARLTRPEEHQRKKQTMMTEANQPKSDGHDA